MIMLSDLLGQDSIALGTATSTGRVKGVAIDGHQVTRVRIGDKSIEAAAVRSFEGDVLTYDESLGFDDSPTSDPRGILVLDMNGDGCGHLADLGLGPSGEVEAVVLDSGDTIPGSRLMVIGSYAAVLGVDLPPPTGQPVA
ncbi:MAG: hypothetical protein QM733_20870 [Ilumatobacteraceae bacterium]